VFAPIDMHQVMEQLAAAGVLLAHYDEVGQWQPGMEFRQPDPHRVRMRWAGSLGFEEEHLEWCARRLAQLGYLVRKNGIFGNVLEVTRNE
jgi:hypothetical protein